jgi:hypothetical protein
MLKVFCSIGAVENSPAIYRGERIMKGFESRQGRAESVVPDGTRNCD